MGAAITAAAAWDAASIAPALGAEVVAAVPPQAVPKTTIAADKTKVVIFCTVFLLIREGYQPMITIVKRPHQSLNTIVYMLL
jgi:hypothetical protein